MVGRHSAPADYDKVLNSHTVSGPN
jgi:hypothetical protein